MKIRIRKNTVCGGKRVKGPYKSKDGKEIPGQVVEASEEDAAYLCKIGKAEPMGKEAVA